MQKNVGKDLKNPCEVDQSCIYQFRYKGYVPVNPWKSPVQSSLNTSGTGHALHFRAPIKIYKKSFTEENVTARHKISAPEYYEFRISTVIYWQSK